MDPSRHPRYAPPPPILPTEILDEIICRLPVKSLLQLRCVCKSWNSLISDPKFARRHLRRYNRRILLVKFSDRSHDTQFVSFPFSSVFKAVATGGTQLGNPLTCGKGNYWIIGSCDGITCCCSLTTELGRFFVLWNPSIRKIWELTPLEKPPLLLQDKCRYGFGYDHFSDSFKLVVIFYYRNNHYKIVDQAGGYHTMVHTVGSNCWRRIENFPCMPYSAFTSHSGKFVSGALNWLACHLQSIVSLDLRKETYQEFLQPDYGTKVHTWTMEIMRDCLCIVTNVACLDIDHSDVWVMREYGNSESWTKLFRLHLRIPACYVDNNSLCVSEDGESLVYRSWNLDIYIYKNGTFRKSNLQAKLDLVMVYDIYVQSESLVSPFPKN